MPAVQERTLGKCLECSSRGRGVLWVQCRSEQERDPGKGHGACRRGGLGLNWGVQGGFALARGERGHPTRGS